MVERKLRAFKLLSGEVFGTSDKSMGVFHTITHNVIGTTKRMAVQGVGQMTFLALDKKKGGGGRRGKSS